MEQNNDKYKNYLFEICGILKKRALLIASLVRENYEKKKTNTREHLFNAGQLLAFNKAISLFQNQAVAFGIPLENLQLEDIDPDRDLL